MADFEEMGFEILSPIAEIEVIAVRFSIRELAGLRREYGPGRWRKLKGVALVQLEDGAIVLAELHWYEAHGIGRRRMKIKRHLEER